jgi:hypothetical protein
LPSGVRGPVDFDGLVDSTGDMTVLLGFLNSRETWGWIAEIL